MVRRALTRQTRWYQNHCSTFKIKDFIVQKPFWKILEFWSLVTSILTWAKKWLKWFRNYFSRAFERRFLFCSTMRRSRDRRGCSTPPSRWWKIQRPSRARVNRLGFASSINYIFKLARGVMHSTQHLTGSIWSSTIDRCCDAICNTATTLRKINLFAIDSIMRPKTSDRIV